MVQFKLKLPTEQLLVTTENTKREKKPQPTPLQASMLGLVVFYIVLSLIINLNSLLSATLWKPQLLRLLNKEK